MTSEGQVRVGTSGWHYDDWRGVVYPEELPTTRWFDHYARRLDTVELNNPFYRVPTPQAVSNWHDQAPPGFRYAVKASRFTTHNLKIGGDRLPESVELITGRLRALKAFLGVVLWQLPPNLHRDADRLARFADLLPGWCRHAVEFRHHSWSHDDVDAVLTDHGVARVWVSGLGQDQPIPRTADFVYLRLHGLGEQAYRHDYTDAELQPWVDRVCEAADGGWDAFVYFNNDWNGHAVTNAERFLGAVQRTGSRTG